MKLLFQIAILTLLIISLSYEACIPGENCPYNQGECQDDQCICKDGFYTLIDSSKAITDQVFCDYEQISMKLMLLMEVLLPGSGQLYSKRWIHGAIKLSIFIAFIIVTVVKMKHILIPKCFIIAKNALIGEGEKKEDSKEEEKKEPFVKDRNDENDDDDNKKMSGGLHVKSLIDDYMSLQDVTKLGFGGSDSDRCTKFSLIIIYIFWTFYSIDIYLIFFLIYSDGEGIPYGG